MPKTKKQKYTDATYKDVFMRIVDFVEDEFGNSTYVNGKRVRNDSDLVSVDEDNGEVCIVVDEDGHCLYWNSIKDFLTAKVDDTHKVRAEVKGCASIFEVVGRGGFGYFSESLSQLDDVSLDDVSPSGLMAALDRAGI